MLGDKRSFIAGLLLAPITFLSLLGGLGTGQSRVLASTTDNLANYLRPTAEPAPTKVISPDTTQACRNRAMNIVAHEDDDILFMNPDLLRGLSQGDCVQTIYMTAGDDGQGETYWIQREHGAEAAYSTMLKQPNVWHENSVKINSLWLVNVATLKLTPNISLVFVRLPDGNLFGDGFASTNLESLQKLETGQIAEMQTVDGQASYKLSDLLSLLSDLISRYQPDQIKTQADDYPDHSDHMAVSRLASQAYKLFGENNVTIKPMPLSFYNGYGIDKNPENVSGEELTQKIDAFLEYAKFDNAVCNTIEKCNSVSTYGGYFTRQYKVSD